MTGALSETINPLDGDPLAGVATFVRVAEAGSFALAAQPLRQTRSAVAKAVARLEARLGARLFHRTTRRLALTEAGQLYYESCKRALAELDAGAAALDEGRREMRGRLRVALPTLLGRHLAAPVLRRFAANHPRLVLELAFSDRVIDLAADGIDLAVRIGPLADSATLAARPLGTQHWIVCAAPGYLAVHGMPSSPEAWAGHRAVVYAPPGGMPPPWRWTDPTGAVHTVTPAAPVRCDDVQAIADAALDGAGLARLPTWLAAPMLRAGTLVHVPGDTPDSAAAVHAVWPFTPRLASKTRAAIDALVAALPPRLAGTETNG